MRKQNSVIRTDPSSAFTIYIALCDAENAISYIPNSHNEPNEMYVKKILKKAMDGQQKIQNIEKAMIVRNTTYDTTNAKFMNLGIGDMALIHGDMVHGLSPQSKSKEYYAMTMIEGRKTIWELNNIYYRSSDIPFRLMNNVDVDAKKIPKKVTIIKQDDQSRTPMDDINDIIFQL